MLLIIIFIVVFIVVGIMCTVEYFTLPKRMREAEKQRRYEKSKKYRDKYVSTVIMEHPYFGRCTLEKDSNHGALTLIEGIKNVSFGQNEMDQAHFVVSENNLDHVLTSLKKAYREADSTLEKFYPEIQEKFTCAFRDDQAHNIV